MYCQRFQTAGVADDQAFLCERSDPFVQPCSTEAADKLSKHQHKTSLLPFFRILTGMKVIILEVEPLAAERLVLLLRQIEPAIRIIAAPDDIEPVVGFCSQELVPESPAVRRCCYKVRLLGRMGRRWFFIDTKDIAIIEAENRMVHIVLMNRTKYLVDHTLDQLERELEPSAFFRINRSIILHARAVEQVKPFINHRLRITLKNPLQAEEVIVSRDRVADFKKWADS
ncbi:MAG: hypothetical protein BGO55_29005 [Sphingobacteriales bacterium 50-39]|nr:MAG: hypothetical protein BGO55_29005 [Sphingobacteriales bacterium 50-39]